jgi:hypothetical protein
MTININSLDIFFAKTNGSQVGNSTIIDQNIPLKRIASLVSLPNNDLPNSSLDSAMNNSPFSPTPMFKSLSQRRLRRIDRRNKNDIEQTSNVSPSVVTMPRLTEFTRRLSHTSSINDNDTTTIIDTQIDSSPKQESPILRTKMPMVNNSGNLKRPFTQKINNYVVQQPLSSIESVLKDRSIRIVEENNNQSNTIRNVDQIFKKQYYLPFDKK